MKKTIAVFFGGRSPEHDISIITAISSVIKPLDMTRRYNVVPVYVTKTGKWISDPALKDIKTYQTDKISALIKKAKAVSTVFDGGFSLVIGRKTIKIDVAFPAMHGAYGEDGSLMGLLRMGGVPFVGADFDTSVIAMDKAFAKQIATSSNIPVTPYVVFSKRDFETDSMAVLKTINQQLQYPVFVKPVHLGSSIGISRVDAKEDLENAIEVAVYYDTKVIVEEAVTNLIEVTVPIMGNNEPIAALVERPLAKDDSFFDFETKYMNNGGKKTGAKQSGAQGYSELPAKLPDGLYEKSVETALATYRSLGTSGMSRIDLLIDAKSKKVYFNEVNPLPGSLYAHNWRAAGMPTIELVEKLIGYAEERFAAQQSIHDTFDSSFLKQF